MRKVSVAQLVSQTNLKVYCGEDYINERYITTSDLSRPGLELTGYFDYYPAERVQILGMTELSYIEDKLSLGMRCECLSRLCTDETPCFIITRGYPVPKELEITARERHIPILISELATTRVIAKVTDILQTDLAPRKSLHGVLVDIYGLGVLITGDSGIGKSEIALDLIKRGHRLIADDRVDVFQRDELTLIGEAPEILRYLLEIRGLGIINVMDLFGAGAILPKGHIDLIMHLENWEEGKEFDRLGSSEQKVKICDVEIPKIDIPVKIGRNLSIIMEVAAVNYRAKTMGFDATKNFERNLNKLIGQNSQQ